LIFYFQQNSARAQSHQVVKLFVKHTRVELLILKAGKKRGDERAKREISTPNMSVCGGCSLLKIISAIHKRGGGKSRCRALFFMASGPKYDLLVSYAALAAFSHFLLGSRFSLWVCVAA
jgi:hypothetical protein